MDYWIYYVIGLLLVGIAAFYIVKKIASCMVKTIVFLVLLAALCAGYYILAFGS